MHIRIKYRNIILDLLWDNYKINFPKYIIKKSYCNKKINELLIYLKENKAVIFGAFNNNLCGFVWVYTRDFFGKKHLHINHIVVKENFRREGIGRNLINRIEEYCKENNIFNIELMVSKSNLEAIKFYKDKGFNIERVKFVKKIKK